MKRFRLFGAVISLFAVTIMVATSSLLVSPTPVRAISQKTKINRLMKTDGRFKNLFEENKTSLENAASETDVDVFYNALLDALNETENMATSAKTSVPYILFANLQEKQALYAALSAIIAQIEVYKSEIEVVYAQYQTDGDVDAANTSLQELNTDIVTYINDHKDEFGEQVRAFLQTRLEAGLATTNLSLTFMNSTLDAYNTLGQDTETLEDRLTLAQEAYDVAEQKYNDGKESNNTKKLMQSAQYLLLSRTLLLTAQTSSDILEETVLQ